MSNRKYTRYAAPSVSFRNRSCYRKSPVEIYIPASAARHITSPGVRLVRTSKYLLIYPGNDHAVTRYGNAARITCNSMVSGGVIPPWVFSVPSLPLMRCKGGLAIPMTASGVEATA